MRQTTLTKMTLGIMLLVSGGVLFADDIESQRERAKAIRKKAAVLAEQGKVEQSQRLEKESMKVLEAAEREEAKSKERKEMGDHTGTDNEIKQLKERLHELTRHASRTEGGERHRHFQAQAENLEFASRKIRHLRVAAEHLKMAEEHDLAHQMMLKSESMEHGLQEAKQRMASEMHETHEHRGEVGPEVVKQLKEELDRLRAEVRELRQSMDNQ